MKTQTIDDNLKKDENVKVYRNLHRESEPLHKHEFIEIAYIYSGHGYQIVNDKKFFVQRGDLVFMGIEDTHSFEVDNEIGILNCLIAPDFLSSEMIETFDPLDILSLTSYRDFGFIDDFSPVIKFSTGKYFDIEYLLDAMAQEFSEKKTGYISAINGYLHALLVKIFRQIAESDEKYIVEEVGKIAPSVLDYIEKNYHRNISLREIAQESFYSSSYFSKIFKECYGKSLTQHINELRINESLLLLENKNLSIEEIGVKVGFSDKKQFYKVFKKFIGKTPGDFRK